MKSPSKTEEIAILRDAANKLGANSYCGPWLSQQIPNIEAEIRADYPPSADYNRAVRDAEQEIANAKARAAEIIADAEKRAAEIRAKAQMEATAARGHARRMLEDAAAKL